ncbi:Sodium:dicarboxylate symporter family protein [Nitrosomonas aestuarii]|uniref:Sodium:dicarboxylate symporter family protein n=1 Tax=Nitrosomonas aestuarii TaxID=52441 RepID=A0A1I4F3K2_9PROT|nr:cation:dicarboxylase symporter family transporter [Nitrosomonas aestuarii]SFL12504.1 Sodium:dicarboxylate symporter family protein [Nitrosomonas aestuarii]
MDGSSVSYHLALLLQLVAAEDTNLLNTLIKFVAIVIGTTLLHGLLVLPLIFYLTTGMTSFKFWQGIREAIITAFTTSSSFEQHLHVKRDIAGFIILHSAPR